MSATTPFASEAFLKFLFTADALPTRPTTWYMSLHTADPGNTGTSEVAGEDANYARQAVTLVASLDGTFTIINNSGDVTFPAADVGSNYTVTWVAIWDAVTAGNYLTKAELPGVGKNITDGVSLVVADGEFTVDTRGTVV